MNALLAMPHLYGWTGGTMAPPEVAGLVAMLRMAMPRSPIAVVGPCAFPASKGGLAVMLAGTRLHSSLIGATADEYDVPDHVALVVPEAVGEGQASETPSTASALTAAFQAALEDAMAVPAAKEDSSFATSAHFAARLRQRWVWDSTPVERIWPTNAAQPLAVWTVMSLGIDANMEVEEGYRAGLSLDGATDEWHEAHPGLRQAPYTTVGYALHLAATLTGPGATSPYI